MKLISIEDLKIDNFYYNNDCKLVQLFVKELLGKTTNETIYGLHFFIYSPHLRKPYLNFEIVSNKENIYSEINIESIKLISKILIRNNIPSEIYRKVIEFIF